MKGTLEALLRSDLFSFARKAIFELEGTKLGDEQYLKYLVGELMPFAEGRTRRLIINLPPGHLKTLLASVCLPAWLLAHDPSLKIIIVTHAEHLSKTISRNIRTILKEAWFREVFETRLKKDHAEVTDFGTTAGGGVFVSSFASRITGRRADVIITDDPHDIGDAPEQIQSTIEKFHRDVLSRLNDPKLGRVLVVAHRVHERDLSANLLQIKKWKHIVLSLIAMRDAQYDTPCGIWRRRKGEFLRPAVYDLEVLERLRATCFNPDFEMLYQQDCDFQALPAIKRDHFVIIKRLPANLGPFVLSVDAGMSTGKRSAFSVIQAWRAMENSYLLLDQFREQCDFADLRDMIRRFRKRFRPVAILIERAANGYALVSDLKRKYGDLVVPIESDGRSKSARLRVHASTIIGRRICIPVGASWANEFITEFVEFPNGKHTDQVDATTQFLDHADRFARLEPPPQAGLAVAMFGNGQVRTITPSPERERGICAGVRGDGSAINIGGELSGPIITITSGVKY